MDLRLDLTTAEGYRSGSQIARKISEDWATRNLFCLLVLLTTSTLPEPTRPCGTTLVQPVGRSISSKARVSDSDGRSAISAYDIKMQAIADGQAPHYAFLQYSKLTSRVTDLFVVPGHFLSPAVIEQRAPLKDTAMRHGWVGSNILIGKLPTEARVLVVEAGVCREPSDVRDEWGRYRFLAGKRGGWAADVLSCVRVLQQETGTNEFTLQAFYQRFETELAARHLDNRNVRPKDTTADAGAP